MIRDYFITLSQLLQQKKLYYFLIPGAVITIGYIYLLWLFGWIGTTNEVTDDLSWWRKMILAIEDSGKWIIQSMYQFIMITLLSPVMAILAERADNHLSGAKFDGGFNRMLTDLLRTILITITAFIVFIIVFLVWNSIAWIVGLQELTPYILFIVNAFFIGFAYTDYALERYKYPVIKSWRYGISNSWTMLGIGALFSALFYIPIIGALAAPFLITLLATSIWYIKETK